MATRADAEQSNSITPARFLALMTRLEETKSRLRAASKVAASERGVLAQIKKEIEDEGFHLVSVKMMETLAELPSGEREIVMSDLFKGSGWVEMPLYRPPSEEEPQGGLFADDPVAKEQAERFRGSKAYTDGQNSRNHDEDAKNPHADVGSIEYVQWAKGFDDADFELKKAPPMNRKAKAKPQAAPADGERKKRGRPSGPAVEKKTKKAAKAPKAAKAKAGAKAPGDGIGEPAGSA